jgi:hypothetical protein
MAAGRDHLVPEAAADAPVPAVALTGFKCRVIRFLCSVVTNLRHNES